MYAKKLCVGEEIYVHRSKAFRMRFSKRRNLKTPLALRLRYTENI